MVGGYSLVHNRCKDWQGSGNDAMEGHKIWISSRLNDFYSINSRLAMNSVFLKVFRKSFIKIGKTT